MSMEERYISDTQHLTAITHSSFQGKPDPFLNETASQELLRRKTLHHEIRPYEISLWTLQDEFITVLKWSELSQSGGVQDAKMTLNVDGTQNLSFSIPMYMQVKDTEKENPTWVDRVTVSLQENPIWYNTRNGNLIADTRKVKVIFNKGDKELEEIYEFLIIKVNEEHEGDILTCKVECESLAFHELGKIGYKYSLSNDEFLADDDAFRANGVWYKKDGTAVTTEPKETVQYWCELCRLIALPENSISIDPNEWYYDIRMNWDSFEDSHMRSIKRVYEESYPTSWEIVNNNTMLPRAMAPYKEKERPVTVSESNLYNITQAIAEAFEIHCKYEYIHDDNYHIKKRIVVFFNNYFQEEDGVFTFTYPYSSSSISRSMDSTDLTTKMFVKPQVDESTLEGEINIMYFDGNKSKEDYLLNFDYMHDIGAISEEQYSAIQKYEVSMRRYNEELHLISLQLAYYEDTKIEKEAKQTTYNESIAYDSQQIKYNSELFNRITGEDGYITRDENNPFSTYVHVKDNGQSYIQFNDQEKGIKRDTIKVYKRYNSAKNQLEQKIDSDEYEIKLDEYGHVDRLQFIHTYLESIKTIYVTYKFQPKLYYQDVLNTWQIKLARDKAALDGITNEINTLKEQITAAENIQRTKQDAKAAEVRQFERMMGPALREGYWQPTNYNDYGEAKQADFLSFPGRYIESAMIDDTGEGMAVGWDADLLETEDKLYYEAGINQDKCYYPCVDLTRYMGYLTGRLTSSNKLSFIFNNNYYKTLTANESNDIKNLTNFTLGADSMIGFISTEGDNAIVKPVLILTGAKDMTDEQINFMLNTDSNKGHPRLGILKVELDENNQPQTTLVDTVFLESRDLYWDTSKTTIGHIQNLADEELIKRVAPRIKCSSTRLKIDIENLAIKYAGISLEKYEGFSVITRITNRKDTDGVTRAYPEYFINIKPEIMMHLGTYNGSVHVDYRLSNATTAIYLDAKDVLQENAYPKVAYEIAANMLNLDFLKSAYRSLFQLVKINDTQLKFDNVFGYISQLELILDQPWEDIIEVKNYKTKFEDLFSSIVAQTEDMQRNSERLISAANGGIPLNNWAFENTIVANYDTFSVFMDNHFDTSEVVEKRLRSIFSEAGKILSNSKQTLNRISALTLDNAGILGGFLENISAGLVPQIFTSSTQPVNFKTGDIWNQVDENGIIIGRYVATSDSTDSAGGFTRTFDGSLAAITGASLAVDAVMGTVNILAQNHIDMKSGGSIYIAANENVDILGNKAVNIGGTRINLASCGGTTEQSGITLIASEEDDDKDEALTRACIANLIEPYRDQKNANNEPILVADNPSFQAAIDAIFFYNSTDRIYYLQLSENKQLVFESTDHVGSIGNINYDSVFSVLNNELVNARISKVVVYPKRIDMTSANIYMKGSSKILAVASNTTYEQGVSAIQVDAYDGVWIGASNGIRLYSGSSFTYNENNRQLIEPSQGASVELNSEHLILGFGHTHASEEDVTEVSAIELTENYVLISKGNIFVTNTAEQRERLQVTGLTEDLVGAKFTDTSIGLAIAVEDDMYNTIINSVLMNSNGVTIGSNIDVSQVSMNPDTLTGSYVRISSTGVEIGAKGDLYLNTNNIKLQSSSTYKTRFALGYNLQNISNTSIRTTDAITSINQTANYGDNVSESQEYIVHLVQNEYGLFIRGSVYANAFFAVGLEGYFKVDQSAMGFFDTSDNPLMSFNNEGNLTVYKNLTITTGKDLIVHASPDNNQDYRFVIDTSAVSSDSILQISRNATWANTDSGVRFSLDDGLEVKGNITATQFVAIDKPENSNQNQFIVNSDRLGFYAATIKNSRVSYEELFTITSEGTISAGADLILDAEKNLYIDTQNVFLDSSNNGDIFILKRQDGVDEDNQPKYENCLIFNAYNGLTIKGALNAASGTIGGWSIDTSSISRIAGNGSAYLHHTTDRDYAIYIGNGEFRVDYNGTAWLNKLIICGAEVDLSGKSSSGGGSGGGSSSFDDAVSLTGEWNGTTFEVSACLFNHPDLTKKQEMSASVSITLAICTGGFWTGQTYAGTGKVLIKTTIEGQTSDDFELVDASIEAGTPYRAGWKDANNAINPKSPSGDTKKIWIPGPTPGGGGDNYIDVSKIYNQGYNDAVDDFGTVYTRYSSLVCDDGYTRYRTTLKEVSKK